MNIKTFSNDRTESKELKDKLNNIFKKTSLALEDNNTFVISVGGDGTFIHALKENNFNSEYIYLGINAGHLGFLQEVPINKMEELPEILKNNDYNIEEINLLQTTVYTKDGNKISFYSFNEAVIKEINSKVIHMEIKINGEKFEKFSGDGIIISTPNGSTAYNMSANGAIIYPTLKTMQVTPICPLSSASYRTLSNSVIVREEDVVELYIEDYYKDSVGIFLDGQVQSLSNIDKVEFHMSEKTVKIFRFKDYSFWEKINSKFL